MVCKAFFWFYTEGSLDLVLLDLNCLCKTFLCSKNGDFEKNS